MQERFLQRESVISNNLDFRLQEAVRRAGGPAKAAAGTGVGASTIYNYVKLKPHPPIDWVYRLAQFSGVRPEWLFLGELPASPDDDTGDWETTIDVSAMGERRVGILDVSASAGFGEEVLEEAPVRWFTMPIDWLMLMGDPDAMVIIKVTGDSMEPDLADGDFVMIDRSQQQPRDGLSLVLVDDHLFLKRLQVTGRNKATLVSSNPSYPPKEIELLGDDGISQDGARVLGRVVWAGRMFR